jgi:hypothetical protein
MISLKTLFPGVIRTRVFCSVADAMSTELCHHDRSTYVHIRLVYVEIVGQMVMSTFSCLQFEFRHFMVRQIGRTSTKNVVPMNHARQGADVMIFKYFPPKKSQKLVK